MSGQLRNNRRLGKCVGLLVALGEHAFTRCHGLLQVQCVRHSRDLHVGDQRETMNENVMESRLSHGRVYLGQ